MTALHCCSATVLRDISKFLSLRFKSVTNAVAKKCPVKYPQQIKKATVIFLELQLTANLSERERVSANQCWC